MSLRTGCCVPYLLGADSSVSPVLLSVSQAASRFFDLSGSLISSISLVRFVTVSKSFPRRLKLLIKSDVFLDRSRSASFLFTYKRTLKISKQGQVRIQRADSNLYGGVPMNKFLNEHESNCRTLLGIL